MPVAKLTSFLDDNNIEYAVINHSPAFTAREVGATTHVLRREVAKTVVVKLGNDMAMAVLAASRRIDLQRLAAAAGVEQAVLADESEFEGIFPNCEVGAMPPFGNLYGMHVYVDEMLTEDDDIVFNACSHSQAIQMTYDDYARLVEPCVAQFAVKE